MELHLLCALVHRDDRMVGRELTDVRRVRPDESMSEGVMVWSIVVAPAVSSRSEDSLRLLGEWLWAVVLSILASGTADSVLQLRLGLIPRRSKGCPEVE